MGGSAGLEDAESVQTIEAKFASVLIAYITVFGECFVTDILRDREKARMERSNGRVRMSKDTGHNVVRRIARERMLACKHLVEDDAEAKDICAVIGFFETEDLLGRKIRDRSDNEACFGQAIVWTGEIQGHAKVRQDGLAVLRKKDIFTFEITMVNAVFMGVLECVSDRGTKVQGILFRERALLDAVVKRTPREVVHHIIEKVMLLAGIVEADQVGVR